MQFLEPGGIEQFSRFLILRAISLGFELLSLSLIAALVAFSLP
ncbi:hypothetical protein LCGC14_0370010 [marine sediment metagenome]|uniref:Uncharacterized protein n=1 Tax=marine sediment metagenome TaxID=412755 RepID=A0A0F9TNJ9_9ZZZZ